MAHMPFEFRIIRSSRKTAAIQVTSDGEVIVRCPRHMGTAAIQKLVEDKSGWISRHLLQQKERPKLSPLTLDEIRTLTEQAKKTIPQRVAHYAGILGVTYGRITIRTQRTRWGSCSSKGNLNFNCLLLLTPPEVLDYVVIHELCHRKEMNHSPAFWREVEAIMPDYQRPRQWLKTKGNAFIARLPK